MEIKSVAVLGCGLMGSGIAQVAATAGFDVTVLEVDQKYLDKGFATLDEAEELMRGAGFSVERHEQFDFIPALVSQIPNKRIARLLANQHIWKMTPA